MRKTNKKNKLEKNVEKCQMMLDDLIVSKTKALVRAKRAEYWIKDTQEEYEKDFYDSGMDITFEQNNFISLKNYQGKLQQEYEKQAKEYKFTEIDASKSMHQQQEILRSHIKKLLKH